MKPELSNTISLTLEGVQADNQHVRLDDFVSKLRAIQDALNCIDREVNGKETLYCRVVDLSHSSPATVKLEVVLRKHLNNPKARAAYGGSPQIVHHRFFESLTSIRFKNERIENTSEETIEAFSELIDGLGDAFTSGAIYNGNASIPLDVGFSENLNNQFTPRYKSNGSVVGDLLAISFAKGSKFYLYPQIGPTSVACDFSKASPEIEKQARACIKKRVRVFGTKWFRPTSGLPFRVNVQRIEEIVRPKIFVSLSPKRSIHKGVSAHDSIAQLRNDWEE